MKNIPRYLSLFVLYKPLILVYSVCERKKGKEVKALDFVTGNLPLILCALTGFGLLIAEAFMPGFGVAGILGIILEIVSVYLAWSAHGLVFALILLGIIIVVTGLTVFFSYRSIMRGRLSKSALILKDKEEAAQPQSSSLRSWIGAKGVTATPLRPAGTVEIDGQRINAASEGDFLPKGTPVTVTGTEGDHVTVRAL